MTSDLRYQLVALFVVYLDRINWTDTASHLRIQFLSFRNVTDEFDHLIPTDASKPFTEVIPSADTDIYEFPTGHVGMAVSGKAHTELWPRVATWFRERSVTQTEESATVDQGKAEAATDQDRSLQTLDGIGPTYEERLHDVGVTTVTQLAAAEPVTLADRLGLSESRVTSWIEQARQFAGSSDDNATSS